MATRAREAQSEAAQARDGEVTVVIPCFNHGEYVGEAVASVLAQDGPSPRIVVVDDGSTDEGTHTALDALPREVEVIRQANAGPAAARNAGIEATDSPYLLMLDADDRLPKGALGELRAALDADPEAGYAYGVMHFFGDWSGEVRLPPYDPYRLLYRGVVGWIGLVRREAWEAAGRFDPELQGFEDWDFTLGALGAGWRGKRLDLVVLDYRKHGRSGLEQDRRRYRELYRRLRSKHAELFKQAPELARESDLGPAGRLAYRTFWAWRPVPAFLERAAYSLLFRPRGDKRPGDEVPEEEPRSMAGGAFLASVARVAFVVAGGAVSILVARLLGPEGSGGFLVISSLMFTLAALGTVGLEIGVGWMLGSGRWDRQSALKSTAFAALVLGIITAAIGYGVYAIAADTAFEDISTGVALTALAALPGALLLTVFTQAAIATQRYEAAAAIGLATAIVYVAGVAGLAVAFDLEGAVGGLLAGQVAGAAVAILWWRLGRDAGGEAGLDYGRLKSAAKFGANVWFANAMVILVYRFDVFLLNAYAGAAEAGYYAVAIAVSGALGVLPTALGSVLMPRLAALESEGDEGLLRETEARALRHTMLILVVTSIVLAVALPVVIKPVFGAEFGPSVLPALILIPGSAALGLTNALYAALAGRGRPEFAFRAALITTPIAIAIYFLLVPSFETEGAALGSTVAYLLSAGFAWTYLRRLGGPKLREVVPGRAEIEDYVVLAGQGRRQMRQASQR
jgi:O-antigen/teichoic acid export membrane protein/glycosyltransferase involved in cell wall biosynthesis